MYDPYIRYAAPCHTHPRVAAQRPAGMEVEMVQSAKKKPQHALTEEEFVNALVRVGYAKFRRLLGVDDRLLWLLKHHVLEHEAVRIVDDPLPAVRGGSAAVAFAKLPFLK